MRVLALILINIVFPLVGFSQNIVDFFESVPDTSILQLTNKERKEIAKYSLDNKSANDVNDDLRDKGIRYAFEMVDIKNGYLKITGKMEGHIQMCYWNMTNGDKLIAIYQEGCGPVCYIEHFYFYEYNGEDFKSIDWHTIIPDIYNDFFRGDINFQLEEMKNKDVLATLLFELPRTGKNIIAKWGNEDFQDIYKKYGLGDRMILIWDDGKFMKGEIYWE